MAHHAFTNGGSFEVFELSESYEDTAKAVDIEPLPRGWYWWPCFPGCLPDNEFPNGPFESEDEAIANALDDE